MNRLAFIIAAALCAMPCCAQQQSAPPPVEYKPPVVEMPPAERGERLFGRHLEPEDSFLADYHAMVRVVLKEAFESDVRLRAIVEPSFSPEFAVALRERAGAFEIFTLEPSGQVWQYALLDLMKKGELSMSRGNGTTEDEIRRLERELKSKPKDLKIARCSIAVEPDLAARLIDAWKHVLEGVRPKDDDTMVLDGDLYHFSMESGGRELRGQVWSPDLRTDPGRLAHAMYEMRDYCRDKDPSHLVTIEQRAGEILAAGAAP